jgi:hypothetical protein
MRKVSSVPATTGLQQGAYQELWPDADADQHALRGL